MRVARRKSEKNLQFFHESFAQIVRDLDAGRLFIRIRTQFRLHEELQPRHKIFVAHAGRVHTFFSRRAEIPEILQNVRRILEQNLHHLDAARLLFRV